MYTVCKTTKYVKKKGNYSGSHYKAITNSAEHCFALINGVTTQRALPRYAHSEAWKADAPYTRNDPNLNSLQTAPE